MYKFLAIAFGLLALPSLAAETVSSLSKVTSHRSNSGYQVELHFDRPIEKEEFTVDLINETVQVNIPGVQIEKGKEFHSVTDERVRNLYTFNTEDGISHRIIMKKGNSAYDFEGKVKMAALGSVLRVTVEDQSQPIHALEDLSDIISALPAKVKTEENKTSANKYSEKPEKKSKVAKVMSSELDESERALFASVDALTTRSDIEFSDEAAAAGSVAVISQAAVSKKSLEDSKGLTESEIPVLTKAKEKKAGGQSIYWRMVASLVIVLALGGAIFYGVKKYSHKQLSKNNHTSIRVMTQHYIGPKKSLAIVTVAGESILIGITDHNITPIKTLSLLEEEIPQVATGSFKAQLSNLDIKEDSTQRREPTAPSASQMASQSVSKTGQQTASHTVANNESDAGVEEEEFSIQGLKDIVSERLKGMRNI